MENRITAIAVQKRNPQKINVHVNGSFSFSVNRVVGAWLSVGQLISDQKMTELKKADDVESAFQSAAHYISYRNRSEVEVRQNLKTKNFNEPIINKVILKLKESGLVDDMDFARQWVELRSASKPRSRWLMENELKQKKINNEMIEQAMSNIPDDLTLAIQAIQQKIHHFNFQEKDVFKKKVASYLLRKGFSYEIGRQAIEQVWEERIKEERLKNN